MSAPNHLSPGKLSNLHLLAKAACHDSLPVTEVAFPCCWLRPDATSSSHLTILGQRTVSAEERAAAAAAPLDYMKYVVQCDVDKGSQNACRGLCSHCGVQGKLLTCTGCDLHRYCSKSCQKAMRKEHRALCNQHKAARAAGTAHRDRLAAMGS